MEAQGEGPQQEQYLAQESCQLPAEEDGYALRVSRSGRVSKTRVSCKESPLREAMPFTKRSSRGKRSGRASGADAEKTRAKGSKGRASGSKAAADADSAGQEGADKEHQQQEQEQEQQQEQQQQQPDDWQQQLQEQQQPDEGQLQYQEQQQEPEQQEPLRTSGAQQQNDGPEHKSSTAGKGTSGKRRRSGAGTESGGVDGDRGGPEHKGSAAGKSTSSKSRKSGAGAGPESGGAAAAAAAHGSELQCHTARRSKAGLESGGGAAAAPAAAAADGPDLQCHTAAALEATPDDAKTTAAHADEPSDSMQPKQGSQEKGLPGMRTLRAAASVPAPAPTAHASPAVQAPKSALSMLGRQPWLQKRRAPLTPRPTNVEAQPQTRATPTDPGLGNSAGAASRDVKGGHNSGHAVSPGGHMLYNSGPHRGHPSGPGKGQDSGHTGDTQAGSTKGQSGGPESAGGRNSGALMFAASRAMPGMVRVPGLRKTGHKPLHKQQ